MPIVFTAALVAAVVPLAPVIDQPNAPLPHIRTLTPMAREILSTGAAQSATFRQLALELDAANVVVYVTTAIEWPTRASLDYLTSAAKITYLLVHVRATASPRDRIAALAHELRHATEILRAPAPIGTDADLRQLYSTVGFRCGPRSYESTAAALTESVVRRELDDRSTKRRR
jgi:hypothetical protein